MGEVLPDFTVIRPTSIPDAVTALNDLPEARLCAGGTDLIVNMRHGLVAPETLIDLGAIQSLQQIRTDADGVHIGAGVSLRALAENQRIAGRFQAITQAALAIAGPTHREAATIGGNLCLDTRCLYYNQSHWWRKSNGFCLKYRGDICHVAPKGNRCRAAFCGDLAPAFMVHHATIDIIGKAGRRQLPLADLYLEDGTDYLTLAPGEILIAVHLPPANATSAYGKIRVRGAVDFPQAGVAIACIKDAGQHRFSLAFTGTNSRPLLAEPPAPLSATDDLDAYFTALGKLAQKTVSPQRTSTMQPHYRRLAIAALTTRLARGLLSS